MEMESVMLLKLSLRFKRVLGSRSVGKESPTFIEPTFSVESLEWTARGS